MSEDSSFDINRKRKEACKSAPDLFGSLGDEILAKENIDTLVDSTGLTPLSFGYDVRSRILNAVHAHDGFTTPESIEKLRSQSGLAPLRQFDEIHGENLERSSLDEEFPDAVNTEKMDEFKNSRGLSPLCLFNKAHKKEVTE